MRLTRHADADAFLAHAGGYLLAREAEHNLILGLASTLSRDPHAYGEEEPYFAVVERGGEVVAASMRTPPHNLILSEAADAEALEPLLEDVGERFETLPGVLGPTELAAEFARRWPAPARLSMSERIYRCSSVVPPAGVAGALRAYRDDDRELAFAWFRAFAAEAMSGANEDVDASLERRLAAPDPGLFFWDDGAETVSLAGCGGPTPNGIRIGPVYTPPELRRRGYASALTAAVTQQLLDGGRTFCFLFTDLANPTSNSIYRRVGYEPVADVAVWAF